jgi:hypothetical protein
MSWMPNKHPGHGERITLLGVLPVAFLNARLK